MADRQAPLSQQEVDALVRRMDAGDFDFDAQTVERMLAMWQFDNARAPYPTVLTAAHESGDAIAMNSLDLMEVSYRLPYSLAYEVAQREKYANFLQEIEKAGVGFAGATILDVGCGLGGLLEVCRTRYPDARLCGVECAGSAIAFIAEHRKDIAGVVANLADDPEAFVRQVNIDADIVLCIEVLEHLIDPARAVQNLLALNPRRALAITVPNGRVDSAAQHINYWSPESWRFFIETHAEGWNVDIGECQGPGSPGGFDNMALIRRRT